MMGLCLWGGAIPAGWLGEGVNVDGINYQNSPEGQEMADDQGAGSGHPLSELDRALHKLMQEGLRHPVGSARRRIIANKIVRLMQRSGRIWHERKPYYEDALFKTWEYFLKNLWEATTTQINKETGQRNGPFCDPDCYVMTRFNAYLKKRLLDGGIAQTKARKERARQTDIGGDEAVAAVERLAAPAPVKDVQAERVREVIEQDPTGELSKGCVKNRPDITAQLLLRRRGLAGESWALLEADLQARVSTLSGSYQKKCLPLLRRLLGVP